LTSRQTSPLEAKNVGKGVVKQVSFFQADKTVLKLQQESERQGTERLVQGKLKAARQQMPGKKLTGPWCRSDWKNLSNAPLDYGAERKLKHKKDRNVVPTQIVKIGGKMSGKIGRTPSRLHWLRKTAHNPRGTINSTTG